MRAIVLTGPGPVENLEIRDLPLPMPKPGEVRIRVRAFGINRSELHLRLGYAENARFPIVPGIEAVGVVDEAPGTDLEPGQQVAAMMGGMGRAFDGGYAGSYDPGHDSGYEASHDSTSGSWSGGDSGGASTGSDGGSDSGSGGGGSSE